MRTIAGCAAAAALALAACGDDGGSGAGTGTGTGTDTAERPPPGVACTLIACSSGVTVELRRLPAAAHDARLCVEGTCRTTDLSRPALAARAPLPRSARHDGARMLVTLVLRNSQGTPIQRYRKRATVQRTRPNGPRCPPVCFQASLRLAGGQLVQRPPVP